MKKIKILLCAIVISLLVGCSTTQMAITGLVLAGTAVGYLAYNWMKDPDASNAYAKSPEAVTKAVKETLSENQYIIIKTDDNNKDNTYMIEAENTQGKKVNIAISPVENNQNEAKVYIKGATHDGVTKAESQILMNSISAKLM